MLYATLFGHIDVPDPDVNGYRPGYRRPDGTRIRRPAARPAGERR
jgi:hypothetical protein